MLAEVHHVRLIGGDFLAQVRFAGAPQFFLLRSHRREPLGAAARARLRAGTIRRSETRACPIGPRHQDLDVPIGRGGALPPLSRTTRKCGCSARNRDSSFTPQRRKIPSAESGTRRYSRGSALQAGSPRQIQFLSVPSSRTTIRRQRDAGVPVRECDPE